MSEFNIITKTANPATINSISIDLINLGVNSGETLLVHSSLSSIGWVCGGAQAVVTALTDTVGRDGTLIMPAHTSDWSDPKEWCNPPVPKEWVEIIYENMPAYNCDVTPTRRMGKIAELFRTFPGTLRSNHPQVSFCANGKLKKEITENHVLTPQFGMDTPLGKLYEMNTKILLLGVDYDSCTSFHLAEALTKKLSVVSMGSAILENNQRVWKWFDDFNYDSGDFNLIGKDFEKNNQVKIGNVGNAVCKLFDMKASVDFAKKWILENRNFI